MKLLLITFLSFISSLSFAGLSLTCEPEYGMSYGSLLVIGQMDMGCFDEDNNKYKLTFLGVGPGLEIGGTDLKVKCPFVNKNRIIAGKPLYISGPKLSAGFVKSGVIAIAANHRGAFCSLSGLGGGIGAAAQLGGFKIRYIKRQ
jgi:hypothetical protein